METQYLSRATEIMSGVLCFKGTRVPVQTLFDYLQASSPLDEFLENFPTVFHEAAIAVLKVAKACLFAHAPVVWCSGNEVDESLFLVSSAVPGGGDHRRRPVVVVNRLCCDPVAPTR